MDLTSFHHYLPAKFKQFVEVIDKNDFQLGIVGGIARDYILSKKIGNDFDCELRPIKEDQLLQQWSSLQSKLKEYYSVEELSYNVLRIIIEDISIELTLPRIEIYDGTQGHSNFKAEHIADLDHSQGFLRRDFTINAIMFGYDKKGWKLIDPLAGVESLKQEQLKECSHAFVKDPVRFLRAFRFRENLRFNFSSSLESLLEAMELAGLSPHYIKQELTKSKRPLMMLKRMLDFRDDFLGDIKLHVENKKVIEYDKLYAGEIECHIKQAIVLSVQAREKILKVLGMSIKNIVPNISFDHSWKSLATESFESELFKQFYETITRIESLPLSASRFEYIMDTLGLDFLLEDFKRFKETSYSLSEKDKQMSRENYKYIIFQKRLKEML